MPSADAAAIPERVVRQQLDAERVLRYALLALFALFLWIFFAWPMAQVLWRSLLDNTGRFSGLANYVRYFRTPAIAASVTNSLSVALLTTLLTVGAALKDLAQAIREAR